MLQMVAVAILWLVSTAAIAQPTFSIEAFDPTLGALDAFGGVPIFEGDILSSPVPGPPLGTPAPGLLPAPGISIPVGFLGLLPGPPEEVDALSYGHDFIPVPFNFAGGLPELWHFSVDSFAGGDGLGFFPSVTTEGAAGPVTEASADIYTSFPGPGPIAPAVGLSNNFGFLDGDGLFPFGAPGYGLVEPNPPGTYAGDNLDAVDVDTTLADISGAPVFFSLDSAFPDPLGIGGNTGTAAFNGFVGGDVLVSFGAGPAVYAAAGALGLDLTPLGPDSDDLDALATFDVDGDLVYTPGIDTLFFSVRRASAVIGSPDSIFGAAIEEGDILIDPVTAAFFGGFGGPFPGIFIPAELLGLGTLRSGTTISGFPFGDDLNALDVLAIPEPATCMLLLIGLGAVVAGRRL